MPDYDVFISHSTRDDTITTRIADALRAAGLIPWLDHDHGITYGDNWSRAIHEAANASGAGLFVMSGHSVRSEYCEAEWNRVLALGKKLYIALIEPLPVADIPLRLGVIQYANLTTNFDAALTDLIAAMKGGRGLDPDAPTTGRAKRISGPFPRYHLDLPLIGRDEELAVVEESLAGNNRITLITGLGGVGKTRLAVEVAARADFADGVIWHEVADYSTLATLTNLIREHLDLPPSEDDAIWDELNRRAVLLVLDNAEVCKEPAAYARRLNNLDTAGGSRVLVTSRARWPDLRHARIHSLAAPSAAAAADILRAMAEAEPPAYSPDGHVEELAEAACYHPRLMRYAVRWLDSYPVDYVLKTLRTLEGADAEEALKELVDHTVQLMKEQEGGPAALAALRRLAVCRGGFTFEAARFIMADNESLATLLRLVGMDGIKAFLEDTDPQPIKILQRWGLVQLEGGRYQIDPLVAAAVGEDEAAHQAHYDYYKALAREHHKKQDYLGLDVESANLEAAFERALAAGRGKDALWLANVCSSFLSNRGRYVQQMDWFKRVTAALVSHPDERVQAAAQHGLGSVYVEHPIGSRTENLMRAVAAFQQALQFATPEVAPVDYAATQNNLGNTYIELAQIKDRVGNLRRTVAAYQEALRFHTPEAAPLAYAMTQMNLGVAYDNLAEVKDRVENLGRALAAYRKALRFFTPEAAPLDYAKTQNNLGNTYRNLSEFEDRVGNLGRAVEAFQEALRFYTPEAAPLAYANTQTSLGGAYRNLSDIEDQEGNLKRSRGAYQEALRFRTPEITPIDHGKTLYGLGNVYRDLAQVEDDTEDQLTNLRTSIEVFTQALQLLTPEAAPLDRAATQNNLGNAYRDLAEVEDRAGNLGRAVAAYQKAQRFYTPEAAPLQYAMTQANLGIAHEELGDLPAAIACWREAEQIFVQLGMTEYVERVRRSINDAEGR